MIQHAFKTGLSFGLTSGVITTLGLMTGLNSGTHSKLVVLSGILTIAFADAFSDALGIHFSEESENVHTPKEIWQSTLFTFISKFIFALTFVVLLLTLELSTAIIVSVIWGLLVLCVLSYYLAKKGEKFKVVLEHLAITIGVILISSSIGNLIKIWFG